MKRRDFLAMSASVAGTILPRIGRSQTRPCPTPRFVVEGGTTANTVCIQGDTVADWQQRISGPGVVWFHDFDAPAEVDDFRWSSGFAGGGGDVNDQARPGMCVWNAAAGIDGGGCLELNHPTGGSDNTYWWRPFSPIVGTGNGRGQDDPAAGGTLTVRPYTPGGGSINGFGRYGYYGNADYHTGDVFDGTEYFLQMAMKRPSARFAGANGSVAGGKTLFLATNDQSNLHQTIVVEAMDNSGTTVFSQYHHGHVGAAGAAWPMEQEPPGISVHGNQPGITPGPVGDGVCRFDNDGGRLANCWNWPVDEWCTVMWHIRHGHYEVADTLVEVFAARYGETTFTKIWSETFAVSFHDGYPYGHNAMILSCYTNGINMSAFTERYDKLILSKEWIPCPQAYT